MHYVSMGVILFIFISRGLFIVTLQIFSLDSTAFDRGYLLGFFYRAMEKVICKQ